METVADILSKIGKSMSLVSVDHKEDNLDFLSKTDGELMREDWATICKDLDGKLKGPTE